MTDELNERISLREDCFCDLAPLYALDLLPDEQRQWIEQQVADCPELALELEQYQLGVTAMPYGVPELPSLSETVKDRLFDRLGLASPAVNPEPTPEVITQPSFDPFFAVRSQNLRWIPHRVPRVQVALLHVDEVRRERVGLLQAEPGMVYPSHRHGSVEEIYMLSGDLELEGITYYGGDYIRSAPGSVHGISRSATGCMFFFRSSFDDEYPES